MADEIAPVGVVDHSHIADRADCVGMLEEGAAASTAAAGAACCASSAAAAATAAATPPPAPAPAPPPPLTEEELFSKKTLDQLNAEMPLGDVIFDYDMAAVEGRSARAPAEERRLDAPLDDDPA